MIFKNCTFFNDEFEKEFGDIEIEDGIIKRIGFIDDTEGKEVKDMSEYLLVPGFIDIHTHGCGGGDASDGKVKSLDKITRTLARNGTTSFCPTTMTLPKETLIDAIKVIADYKDSKGAKIIGINLEGPFLSLEKKGAQNGDYIRAGTLEEFNELMEASGNTVKLITIAPEAFDSKEFIKEAGKACTVSIGHSAATTKQCKKAIENGIRHVTHLYNAMTAASHREAAIVGSVLDDERVMCEIVCDGGHICPAMLRNTFKILGEDRAVVISDSMRGAGLSEGVFDLGGQQVYVFDDIPYGILQDGTIAASITNIHQEFKNLISYGIDMKTALKACTINPARSINEEERIGSIKIGKCADLVFLDNELDIEEVYIDGILA